ncbi:MAG: putative Insulin-degRading enzyme [Bacteriovoracaceae bacterium]|nr:putative Insulin-degRading enzyme [Bacteriovoracaceae bacterium]
MKSLNICLFGFIALCFSFSAFATPEIHRFDINGYDFYIVDVKAGNEMALEGFVKTGFLQDIKPGLSHLLEHLMHNGSKKYPGRDTLRKKMEELGTTRNAHTSDAFTRYFVHFQPENLESVLSYYGATFHSPTFEDFLNERGTVIQEVVNEYLPRDAWVGTSLPTNELLKKDHFLNKFRAGTESDLKNMSETDARELFESNYLPGQMTWILTGNFQKSDAPKINNVAKMLRENFLPAEKQLKVNSIPRVETTKLPDYEFPDMHSPVYVEGLAKGDRSLFSLRLWMPASVEQSDYGSFEILTMLLSLDIDGSLQAALKKKGWVISFDGGADSAQNKVQMDFQGELTDLGLQNRAQIMESIYGYLKNLEANPLPQDLIDMLKARDNSDQMIVNRSAEDFTRNLSSGLIRGIPIEFLVSSEEFYAKVTPASVQQRAHEILQHSQILASTMIPAKKIPLVEDGLPFNLTSQNLGVKFRIPPAALALDAIKKGSSGESKVLSAEDNHWTIKKVPLTARSEPLKGNPNEWVDFVSERPDHTERSILRMKHSEPTGALDISIKFASAALESEAYGRLFFKAFVEHFKSEFTYLSSMGVLSDYGFGDGELSLSFKDNAESTLQAAEFLFRAYRNFVPGMEDIKRAVLIMKNELDAKRQGFNAFQPFYEVYPIFERNHFHSKEILSTFENKTIETLQANLIHNHEKQTVGSDFQITMVGDYNEASLERLKSAIRSSFPSVLPLGQIKGLRSNEKNLQFWAQMGPSKTSEDYGGVRAYNGADILTKDHAILSVLSNLLGDHVSNLNRQMQGLGYAHSATLPSDGRAPFIFYGGVTGDKPEKENSRDGITQFNLMTTGWDRLIAETAGVYDEKVKPFITDAEILKSQKGLLTTRKKELVENSEIASRLHFYLKEVGAKDALTAFEKETAMIGSLTVEDLREGAKRLLLNAPSLDIITSTEKPNFCRYAISSLEHMRTLLK